MPIFENFISYRRSETLLEVKNIYDALKNRGYSTFCDIYSLDNGNFDENLIESVALCTNYILVINNRSLDRCSEEGDWLLKEIKIALEKNKNTVIVFVGEVDFKNLPPEIDALRYKNGMKFDVLYFDAFIDELTRRFLVSEEDWTKSSDEDFVFNGDTLEAYRGSSKRVIIPPRAKIIGPSAFKDNTALKELIFSEGLLEIGASAFERCLSLAHVELPDTLKKLGRRAFARCYNLLNIQFNDGLSCMEEECLAFCTGLKNILLPKGLSYCDGSAFDNCNLLARIDVPDGNGNFASKDGVLYTGDMQTLVRCPIKFKGGGMLVPESTMRIGKAAFSACNGLTEVILPDTLEQIESKAFANMRGIGGIKIPRCVKFVDASAFDGWQISQIIDFSEVETPEVRAILDGLTVEGGGAESFALSSEYILVKTTFEAESEAVDMAKGLLKNRLIVSGQISKLRSIYVWDNNISDEGEYELSCITRGDRYAEVEKYIHAHHSFELCELMVIPVAHVPDNFGGWVTGYVGKNSDLK